MPVLCISRMVICGSYRCAQCVASEAVCGGVAGEGDETLGAGGVVLGTRHAEARGQ